MVPLSVNWNAKLKKNDAILTLFDGTRGVNPLHPPLVSVTHVRSRFLFFAAAYADTRILPLVWKPSPLALMAKYFRRQKEHPDYQVQRMVMLLQKLNTLSNTVQHV